MKKVSLFVLSIVTIVVIVALYFNNTRNGDSGEPIIELPQTQPSVQHIDAAYMDGSGTLQEMKEKSDLIIIGKPVSVFEQRKYGVLSNIQVMETLKGNKYDTIKIYQLGAVDENLNSIGDVLQFNQTYFLFLGKQQDGQPDTFYVKAGLQGAFLQGKDKQLSTGDQTMSEQLKQLTERSDKNKRKTDTDALVEFLLQSDD